MTIVGHGSVLIGFVRSGTVAPRQVTQPLELGGAASQSLVIKSVQRLSSTEGGQAVCLVFVNGPHLEVLRRAMPAGSILVLEESGP